MTTGNWSVHCDDAVCVGLCAGLSLSHCDDGELVDTLFIGEDGVCVCVALDLLQVRRRSIGFASGETARNWLVDYSLVKTKVCVGLALLRCRQSIGFASGNGWELVDTLRIAEVHGISGIIPAI